jgi:hypothetical protein
MEAGATSARPPEDPADRLAVHLPDALGEHPQRVEVGWNAELVEMLQVLGEQTNVEPLSTEIESSVQHVKRGRCGCGGG